MLQVCCTLAECPVEQQKFDQRRERAQTSAQVSGLSGRSQAVCARGLMLVFGMQAGIRQVRLGYKVRAHAQQKGHTLKNFHKVSVQPSPSTKMVDGAARTSGERGLPFLQAPEQSKESDPPSCQREREREGGQALGEPQARIQNLACSILFHSVCCICWTAVSTPSCG